MNQLGPVNLMLEPISGAYELNARVNQLEPVLNARVNQLEPVLNARVNQLEPVLNARVNQLEPVHLMLE